MLDTSSATPITDSVVDIGTTVEDTIIDTVPDVNSELEDLLEPMDPLTTDDTVHDVDAVMIDDIEVVYDGRTTDWSNWIGKYRFQGASENFLVGMYAADADRDGFVTLAEAITVIENIGGVVPDNIKALVGTVEDDFRWDQDIDLMTQFIPMAWDENGDGELSHDEAKEYFYAFGAEDEFNDVWHAAATIKYDDLLEIMRGMRYTSDRQLG